MASNAGKDNRIRSYSLDVLRCIAMVMVVILHYLDKGGILRSLSDEGSFSAADCAAWIMEALSIVAVNLYMLLSGYLLSRSSFKLSRLAGLVCKVWLYSVIVGFIGIALNTPAEPVDTYFILRLIFPISMNTYWFMTAYIFFYILVPVLSIAADRMDKAGMKLLLGCLIFFHVIIKTVVPAQLTGDAGGMDAMWYIILFFVAAYIRKFTPYGDMSQAGRPVSGTVSGCRTASDDKTASVGTSDGKTASGKKRPAGFFFAAYILFTLPIFAEAYVLRLVYLKTGSLSYILDISYSYNHLLVLASSVALFTAFLCVKVPEKAGKVFAFLGKYSLGVYLLHENLSVRYAWEPVLFSRQVTGVIQTVLFPVFAGIIVFAAGVLIDFLGSSAAHILINAAKKTGVFNKLTAAFSKADSVFNGSAGTKG